MNITIKTELQKTLNELASVRSMTPEVYAQEYLENHLTSRYKTNLVEKVQNESIENMAEIEDAIDEKKAEIKIAYDLANPVIVEELVVEVPVEPTP